MEKLKEIYAFILLFFIAINVLSGIKICWHWTQGKIVEWHMSYYQEQGYPIVEYAEYPHPIVLNKKQIKFMRYT